MESERRVRVLVSGRVQGVWFRDSTRLEGERLALTGWVRNLADGRVEAVFQGAPGAVEEVLDWCRIGPPQARVDDLVIVEERQRDADGGFAVRATAAAPSAP